MLKSWPPLGRIDITHVCDAIESSSLSRPNNFVSRLESAFADLHKCKYGISVTNGSHAIELASRALGLQDGDEVIVPAFTFVAAASSLKAIGVKPVPADVDSSFSLTARSIAKAVTSKTRAVLPVHLAGVSANMPEILEESHSRNLLVIEDCCQAHGASYRREDIAVPVGSESDAAVFSFQSAKVISAGEGGVVLTNREDVYSKILPYISYGRDYRHTNPYNHFTFGSNYRMTEVAAAIAHQQIQYLADDIALRKKATLYLHQRTREKGCSVSFQEVPEHAVDVTYSLLFMLVPASIRNTLIQELQVEGFPARPAYPLFHHTEMLHWEKVLDLSAGKADCPTAAKISETGIAMPHWFLCDERAVHDSYLEVIYRVMSRV